MSFLNQVKHDPKDIVAEVEDLIRTQPDPSYDWYSDEAIDWLGRARALLTLSQLNITGEAMVAVNQATAPNARDSWIGKTAIRVLLSQVRHSLRMQTVGPLAVAVSKGMVFDYFDGLKKIIQEARSDLLVVDPYMDAEFVSRYLPFVEKSVCVRLLASKHVATLEPAAMLFSQQSSLSVEVRKARSLHDRFIFVDGKRGFQSGASFHQGGVTSPTTLTEVTDTLVAVRRIYEDFWSNQ